MSSDIEIAVAAQHRLPLPGMGPQCFQSHFVRYHGSQQNVEGSWTSASSPTALSKGFAADFIRIEILEAPAEWAVPTRVERYIKPPFKIRVVVGHRMSVAIPMRIKACLLTEQDVKELQTWDPIPVMQDPQSAANQVYTSLKGESEKCECIQAQYVPSISASSLTAKEQSSSCNSMQDVARPSLAHSTRNHPGVQAIAEDAGPSRTCISNPLPPRNSGGLDAGDRYQSPGTSDESVDSMAHGQAAQRGSDGKGDPAHGLLYPSTQQQAITVCEIPFPDLRFAKPSRMHPVYIAFCSTLPFCEDTLVSLFTVPTVVTCRAEQGAAALKRLGRPQDLMSQATALRSSPTTHHTSSSAELGDNNPNHPVSNSGELLHTQRSSSTGSRARGMPFPPTLSPHGTHGGVMSEMGGPMDVQSLSGGAMNPSHIPAHPHAYSGPHSSPALTPPAPFPTSACTLPLQQHSMQVPFSQQLQAAQQQHAQQQHAQQHMQQQQQAQLASQHAQGGANCGGGWQMSQMSPSHHTASTPFLGAALCPPPAHESSSSAAAGGHASTSVSVGHNGSRPAYWQGSGYQGPHAGDAAQEQAHALIWQQGSTCSSGSAAVSAALSAAVANVQPQHQQQQLQPPHPPHAHNTLGTWGVQGAQSDEGSRSMQETRVPTYPAHASAPLPMLPPSASASVAAPMPQGLLPNTHMLGAHYEPTPAGLAAWLEEEYQSTGLTRKLTQADIQTLVMRSGLQPTYSDPTQQHHHMAQIMAHVRAIFAILKQISSLWNQTHPIVVVAGFEVGRDDAARVLSRQPVGTFVCRISLSGSGGLALAVKALPDHPQAGPDGIVHVLMTPHDLNMRRADAVVRDLPGATHLLDLYTCKRVDKRKIFATHYTHLKKLEHLQGSAEHSAYGLASSKSAGSLQWLPRHQSQQPSGEGSTHADDPVTQAEKEAAMEYPLVDLPIQAVLGSNAADLPASSQPTIGDMPPAAAAAAAAAAPIAPMSASFDGQMGAASSAQSGGINAALAPTQRPGSTLPAIAPTSYPSLTLDILDQSTCVAMLNDCQDTQARASLPPPVPIAPSPMPRAATLGNCDEDVPMPILDKEEQSMVNMLIDG